MNIFFLVDLLLLLYQWDNMSDYATPPPT